MNVSLSALERLLHRYTMEPTTKPFDVRSVPIETIHVEQPKSRISDLIFVIFVKLFLIFFLYSRYQYWCWCSTWRT